MMMMMTIDDGIFVLKAASGLLKCTFSIFVGLMHICTILYPNNYSYVYFHILMSLNLTKPHGHKNITESVGNLSFSDPDSNSLIEYCPGAACYIGKYKLLISLVEYWCT